MNNQGELAIALEYDSENNNMYIEACAQLLADTTQKELAAAYISLCQEDTPIFSSFCSTNQSESQAERSATPPTTVHIQPPSTRTPLAIFAGKKYKPVTCKIRPIETELPSWFHIIRDIRGDLLQDMLRLNPQPPDFIPTGCYTEECRDQFNQVHDGDFLLPEERKLIHHFMCQQNGAFAWTDQERGHFREDFFPPVEIPTIPHKPWTQRNIPILPGIYDEVCRLIKLKINVGVYEPSNSSY